MVDLGTDGAAAGINDKGSVVGHARGASGATAKASVWASGTHTPPTSDDRDDILEGSELDDDAPEGSEAFAIDADDRVVGMRGFQAFIAAPR